MSLVCLPGDSFVERKLAVTDAAANFDFTILPLPKFSPTEIILVSPCSIDPSAESSVSLPPLITFPHGGPHSVTLIDGAVYKC